jgi:SNF2 family DNA or RNA helicase
VIYYSQDYRLETRLQSEDRAHRIGQKKTVTYLDIVARKTVDQQIIAALRKKKDLADEIVDARALRRMLEL